MSKLRRVFFRALMAAVLVAVLAAVFHAPLLNALARTLIHSDPPVKSDAIVVLAGDYKGERLAGAADLWKKGYGKKLVFWGGPVFWEVTYAEMYLRFLKAHGIPPEAAAYSEERLGEMSTRGEADVNMALLEKIGAKSFIVVTSDYHSARALRVYGPRAKKRGLTLHIFPVKEKDITLDGWWHDRASAKMVYLELEKALWYRVQNLFFPDHP